MAKKNLNEMSFLDHLEELRWLLVRGTAAVLIMAIATFFISDYVFDTIIFGPTKTDFVTYRFFCDLSHYVGFKDSICVESLPFIIQNTNMEGLSLYIMVALGFCESGAV